MSSILTWAGTLLFILVLGIGFFSISFGIPGTWIILLDAFLYAWMTHFSTLSFQVLIVLTLLAVSGEALELFLSIKGVKKAKPSRGVILVSFFSGIALAIVMAPLFFGLGAILGALIGTFGGAFLMEYLAQRRLGHAARIGWKAFLGRLSGFLSKIVIAIIMLTIIFSRLFFH